MVADPTLRGKLLEAREANYQKLRIRQGLRPGSPFNRQPPTNGRTAPVRPATDVNVVEADTEQALALEAEGTDLHHPEDFALTGEAREDA